MPPPGSSSPDPPPRPPDLGLVDGLVQTSFLVQSILAELAAEHELSVTQVRLLGVLRDREPRMTELAQLLGLTKSSVTGLVDRAEQRGLLRRVSLPVGDERAVHVELTDAARELIAEVADQFAMQITAITEDLSDSGRGRLSKLLTGIVARHARASRDRSDADPSAQCSPGAGNRA